MKVGTKSLLFGVHQIFWHPVTVWIAWVRLFGLPNFKESICIFIHDWGYWGCADMDGATGASHPFFGARIAGKLFGNDYYWLVLWHSRHLAKRFGAEPSKLCWADKFSMLSDPRGFYLLRARLSGEILEYRRHAAASGFIPQTASDTDWHEKLTLHLADMALAHAANPKPC